MIVGVKLVDWKLNDSLALSLSPIIQHVKQRRYKSHSQTETSCSKRWTYEWGYCTNQHSH